MVHRYDSGKKHRWQRILMFQRDAKKWWTRLFYNHLSKLLLSATHWGVGKINLAFSSIFQYGDSSAWVSWCHLHREALNKHDAKGNNRSADILVRRRCPVCITFECTPGNTNLLLEVHFLLGWAASVWNACDVKSTKISLWPQNHQDVIPYLCVIGLWGSTNVLL